MNASAIAAALGERAEAVCRQYLPHGRRQGRYWVAGDLDGARGRSLFDPSHHARFAHDGRVAAECSMATCSPVSGAGCPPEFQLDAGSKFQGRSSRMRDCGWPAAIFSSVFVSQA